MDGVHISILGTQVISKLQALSGKKIIIMAESILTKKNSIQVYDYKSLII